MRTRSKKTKPPTPEAPTRVLFIAGALRSGSTLLDRMVGMNDGFCSIGEAHVIWKASFDEGQPCGCGAPFHECGFWDKVSRHAFDVPTVEFDPTTAIHLMHSVGRIRHSPWLLSPRRPKRFQTALPPYGALIKRLYSAIQAISGARMIIDSSKSVAHALILAQLPGVEVHVVHLVRDPRAVAFSWQRERSQLEVRREASSNERVSTTAAYWLGHNTLAERLSATTTSYCRLRYEDFIADPDRCLSSVLEPHAWAGGIRAGVSSREILLEPAHTVAGNRMRFTSGTVALELDDQWREAMTRRDRQTVEAITWPLLTRYGYRLGTGG